MRLVTVGTGTVAPHPARVAAGHLVDAGTVRLLCDCGGGVVHRLAALGLDWGAITHVALTHFHPDHVTDLVPLCMAFRYGQRPPREAPLTIVGPVGTRAFVDRLGAALGDWLAEPGYPLDVVEVPDGGGLDLADDVRLDARSVPHTDESVALSVRHAGRRLVYTGDTGPDDGLGAWAAGCDLLLAECSLPDAMAVPSHLTPAQAGALAARAACGQLVLTHCYPPVESVDIAAEVAMHYTGPVTVAADGDTFTV
jgi:ribonuclease BN (tRNA processing enzyme)